MRRGIVLTTDSVMALMLALVFAGATLLYVRSQEGSRFSELNLVRTAYDIGFSLDRTGALASNNRTVIETALNATKPGNLLAAATVERYVFAGNVPLLFDRRRYGDEMTGDRLTEKVVSSDGNGILYLARVEVALK